MDRSHDISDEKLPIPKLEELIKALEKMGFFVPENQKTAIFDTNTLMTERQLHRFTRAKILVEAF